MRARQLIVPLLLLSALPALAGEIYGTITEGGRPVGEGVAVEARCGEKAYPQVKTDKAGGYHVVVAETGKCSLTVHHKGQTPRIEVASYEEGVQVDLELVQAEGKYTVRRK
jgi:hypothetical protein